MLNSSIKIGPLIILILFPVLAIGQAQNGRISQPGDGAQSGGTLLSATAKEAMDCLSLGSYCGIPKCAQNKKLRGSCSSFGNSGYPDPNRNETTGFTGTNPVKPPSRLQESRLIGPGVVAGQGGGSGAQAGAAAGAGSGGGGAGSPDSSDAGSPQQGDGNNGGGQSQAQCQQAAQQASSVCNSGGGGNFAGSNGGINSFASSLTGATGSAAESNIQQGAACTSAWRACEQACQSVNPAQASQCQSLANKVAQMGQQAQSLGNAQQQAANSGQQSSANGNGYSKGTENCSLNPNTEECRALAESQRYRKGESGFEASKANEEENFNLESSTDGMKTQFNGSGIGIDQIQPGARNGTIANNSGGGIPGSGGDSGGAQLDRRRGYSPGSPGYTTDVLQGFQGGSGSGGSVNGGNMNVKDSSGFSGSGSQQAQRGPASQRLDLKRYLPGGSRQLNTRNLGGFIPFSTEINGPHVNIWDRISDRFMEKCKLGELIDCQ